MAARAWDVYEGSEWTDTVWFDEDCDKEYVLKALIEHDGYPGTIRVVCDDVRGTKEKEG